MDTSFFSFLHFFAFLVNLYLIILLLYKDPSSLLNRVCSVFLGCFCIWSFGLIIVHNPHTNSKYLVEILNNIEAFGWINFSGFFLWFVLIFTKNRKALSSTLFYLLITVFPTFFIYKQWSGELLGGYIRQPYGWTYFWSDSIWHYLFYIYYSLLMFVAIYQLFAFKKKTRSVLERKQAEIMLITVMIALIAGSISNVLLPELKFYYFPPLANVIALIWAIGIVYAMIKYKFFSITPATAAENIISTMSDALILIDLEGNIMSVNKATIDMFGYREKELRGKSIDIIFTRKDFKIKLLYKAIKGEALKNYNLIFRTKSNRNIPVIFSSSPLKDKEGNVIGVVCVAQDITELKRTESQLEIKIKELEKSEKSLIRAFADLKEERRKSEEAHNKVVAIINNFIDPIIVIDKNSRLSLINPAAKEIFGFTSSNLGRGVGKDDNYSMKNFQQIIKKDYQVKTGKEIKAQNPTEEEVVINYEGQELTYKVITAEVLDNENEYLGTMKIFYNLTREKTIDKMKSEFISIAAHQLRTPLSAIKWIIKMVLDGDIGKINKEQYDLLFKGYRSNERIIALVNDMLNVSRIEEGRFSYSFSNSDFLEVLNNVKDNLENRIKEKNINLTLEFPPKMPKVYMDKEKMTLVLQNLLENAVKYTPESGKVSVKVEKGSKFLKVKVKDNGVGIPAKDQLKLFTKFFRATNVRRMQTEGSGLGLFIVKNVIQRHGGAITCESKEGRGTEFTFTLPL